MTPNPDVCQNCEHPPEFHTTMFVRYEDRPAPKGRCCKHPCQCNRYVHLVEPFVASSLPVIRKPVVPGTGERDPKYPEWEKFSETEWRRVDL